MRDHTLDTLLTNRLTPPPRHGFEQRILVMARTTPQRVALRPLDGWRHMLGELRVPQMQLVYALVLTIGLALGFTTPAGNPSGPQTYLNDDGVTL